MTKSACEKFREKTKMQDIATEHYLLRVEI